MESYRLRVNLQLAISLLMIKIAEQRALAADVRSSKFQSLIEDET